jgi:polyisoprenoid-binding protein YceI
MRALPHRGCRIVTFAYLRGWAVAALAVSHAPALLAQALPAPPLPLRAGEVVIDVRATTVNDFDVRAAVARAEYGGGDLSRAAGFFEVRVAEMRSGIGLRDRHLRNTLRADSFPVIRFDLVGIDAGPAVAAGDSTAVTYQGRLTIRGVMRAVRVPGAVVRGGDSLVVIVSRFPLNLAEYGVRPPSRFLGAVRVQDDVHVSVRLTFRR